jgi:hypothetical protein
VAFRFLSDNERVDGGVPGSLRICPWCRLALICLTRSGDPNEVANVDDVIFHGPFLQTTWSPQQIGADACDAHLKFEAGTKRAGQKYWLMTLESNANYRKQEGDSSKGRFSRDRP